MTPSIRPRAAHLIDQERLWYRHLQMARHGATAAGGVNRQALSQADIDAQRTLIGWARELGLVVATDPVGNLFLRLPGRDVAASPVLTGSHIDSQPTGGKFDGIYGVLAGLESVQAIIAAEIRPLRSIDVVGWMNEEGSRFAPGMMGSRAFTGACALESILEVRDAQGVEAGEALAKVRQSLGDIPQWPLQRDVWAYVEAHIEQGPLLERTGHAVGVVSGIQGKRTFSVTVAGAEAHVGTTPEAERRDALVAAIEMISAMRSVFLDAEGRELVKFSVGRFDVKPNVPSVVPALVSFSIDLRHPESAVLAELGDQVESLCLRHARSCAVQVNELSTAMSITFPESMRAEIRRQADLLGIAVLELLSAAGHDARYLHHVCPTGMIFVPCRGGLSHNEAEHAEPEHLAAGARVLVETLLALADPQ